MRVKKIFVTGYSGFVGQNLIPRLVSAGFNVTVFGRKKILKNSGFNYVKGDLLEPKSYNKPIIKHDIIVHLASIVNVNYSLTHPQEVLSQNINMLLNILEVLRKNKKKPIIIFASTDRLYGKTKKRVVDENEIPYPMEPYTASKILCEVLLETYNFLYGIPYIILRFDSIYGPHQPEQMFVSNVIRKMMSYDEFDVGKLDVRKNFIYVDDIASSIIKAVKTPQRARNSIYNIGGGSKSLEDVLNSIRRIFSRKLNKKVKVKYDPLLVRKAGTEVNPFSLSTAKAEKYLKWKQKISLERGLEKTIDYFIKEKNVNG